MNATKTTAVKKPTTRKAATKRVTQKAAVIDEAASTTVDPYTGQTLEVAAVGNSEIPPTQTGVEEQAVAPEAIEPQQGELLEVAVAQAKVVQPEVPAGKEVDKDQEREEFKKELSLLMKEIILSDEMQEAMRQSIKNIVASVFKERADKSLAFRRASLTPSSHPRQETSALPRTFNNTPRPVRQTKPATSVAVKEVKSKIGVGVKNNFDQFIRLPSGENYEISIPFYTRKPEDSEEKVSAIMESAVKLDRIFTRVVESSSIETQPEVLVVQSQLTDIAKKVFSEDVLEYPGVPRIDVYEAILGSRMPTNASPERAAEIDVRENLQSILKSQQMVRISQEMAAVLKNK